jgi:hypothetical protein
MRTFSSSQRKRIAKMSLHKSGDGCCSACLVNYFDDEDVAYLELFFFLFLLWNAGQKYNNNNYNLVHGLQMKKDYVTLSKWKLSDVTLI